MVRAPTISIVIPLFNKEAYIRRSIDLGFAQTFADFEVIVVDDGSTDDSADIVRRYSDPRIRLIRQENAGVSAARNRGIAAATTPFVALLDADDEWRPGFLEKVSHALSCYPDAVGSFSN